MNVPLTWSTTEMSAPDCSSISTKESWPVEMATTRQVNPPYKKRPSDAINYPQKLATQYKLPYSQYSRLLLSSILQQLRRPDLVCRGCGILSLPIYTKRKKRSYHETITKNKIKGRILSHVLWVQDSQLSRGCVRKRCLKYTLMCGIVAAFDLKADSKDLRTQVLEMSKKIRHRGPD